MSKIKVSALTDEALNDQVALALGWQQRLWGAVPVWFDPANENRYRCHVAQWKPSTNPAQAYPIIEKFKISTIIHSSVPGDKKWGAWSYSSPELPRIYGPTAIIAAMRCYVRSKFGEEVDE